MTIYLTGLHSSTNPQPGVGSVRSLRAAYPDANIIGVDYSPRSSGIHWPELDAVELQRPWEEMHLPTYAARIREKLDGGALWLSGSDLESRWLATQFPDGHAGLLSPTTAALNAVAKPAVPAHNGLPVRIAPFVAVHQTSDWDLHHFCRQHDWNLWLKGPYYDAVRVGSWPALESGRAFLSGLWTTEELFLQRNVAGHEESVCFCAYRGELLAAVRMRKRDLTEMAKTWAGDISEVPENFLAPLRKIVRDLNWTGGGEIEMVRDADGTLWLLEWNPRFPAWIHGSTLAGTNLPAILVEAATGEKMTRTTEPASREFTRCVVEVPVKKEFPLPPMPEILPGGGFALKHPSGLLGLAKSLHGNAATAARDAKVVDAPSAPLPTIPAEYLTDLAHINGEAKHTPAWLYLPQTVQDGFQKTAAATIAASTPALRVRPGYSIKTNPDSRLLKTAREAGFLAECITLLEVRKAISCGFPAEDVVLNGPGKWHPDGVFPDAPLHALFADSLDDLARCVKGIQAGTAQTKTLGLRLRPPHIPSRFGIPVATPEALDAVINAVDGLPAGVELGIHVHMASSHVGVDTWWRLFSSTLHWCRSIETLMGRGIHTLDLGGGWASEDWHVMLNSRLPDAAAAVREHLPGVRELLLEPGKALAGPSMALAMRILEIKKEGSGPVREVVVDGSIADLPMGAFQPHRILHRDASGALKPLARGHAQLQGRLCMEHDFVATSVALPDDALPGDLLIFCDAGAYDKSMSYVFGCG